MKKLEEMAKSVGLPNANTLTILSEQNNLSPEQVVEITDKGMFKNAIEAMNCRTRAKSASGHKFSDEAWLAKRVEFVEKEKKRNRPTEAQRKDAMAIHAIGDPNEA